MSGCRTATTNCGKICSGISSGYRRRIAALDELIDDGKIDESDAKRLRKRGEIDNVSLRQLQRTLDITEERLEHLVQ